MKHFIYYFCAPYLHYYSSVLLGCAPYLHFLHHIYIIILVSSWDETTSVVVLCEHTEQDEAASVTSC